MVSKTREKLIEVARQLFVNKGVENTTMNDIATASEKGRRTIYTYFKNKKEIFDAVIESESNAIIGQLKEILESDMSCEEKLRAYLRRRIEVVTTSQKTRSPYERYRSIFSRDARRVEKIFELARKKEQTVFLQLLDQGVKSGVFDPEQAERLPAVMSMIFMTSDHLKLNSIEFSEIYSYNMVDCIIDFVTKGITKDNNQHKSILT